MLRKSAASWLGCAALGALIGWQLLSSFFSATLVPEPVAAVASSTLLSTSTGRWQSAANVPSAPSGSLFKRGKPRSKRPDIARGRERRATRGRMSRNVRSARRTKKRASKYEVKELTTLAPTHWVRVPEGPLQRLKSEPSIKLLRVPTKAADASATIREDEDKEEQHVEVEVRRHEFPQLLGARRQGVPHLAGGRFRRRKKRAPFDLRVRLLRQALG